MDSTQPPAASSPSSAPAPRKSRVWKFVKWTFLLIVLLVVGAGTIVYLKLNAIVEHAVEDQTTLATNLKTELGGARLALFGGSLDLDELQIGSPKDFTAPNMLTLGNANMKVKFDELRSDPVRISSITLDKPKLIVERGADGRFNFKAAADAMPPSESETVKLIIDELTIKDPVVVVRPGKSPIPGLELKEEYTLPIPTITMKQIGSGEGAQNGAAVKDVVMQVVTVLVAKASESGGIPPEFQALLKGDLSGVVAKLGGEAQKRIAESVGGPVGDMIKGLDLEQLKKDPGAALKQGVQGQLGNILGGATGSSTQPSTQQSDPAKKAVEEGLKGLLGGKKKDDKK